MDDSSTMSVNLAPSLLNPWLLNFQKLGLELKCPRCLKLFTGPILLRCNHIICSSCVSSSPNTRSECPLCKAQVVDRVTRPMPFVENLVAIYRSLDGAFSNMVQLFSCDAGGALERYSSLDNNSFGGSLIKDRYESGQLDKSCGRQQSKKSSNLSVHDVVESDFDRYGMPQDEKGSISEMDGNGRLGEPDEFRSSQTELNQTEQLSANGPFGDGNGSEFSCDEYRYQTCSKNSSENSVDKRPDSRISGDKTKVPRHTNSLSEAEGHCRDAKRQKNLYPRQLELGMNGENHTQLILEYGDKVTLGSELKHPPGFSPTSSQPRATPFKASENKTICAFCQSCTISKVTGQMLSYANGSLSLGDDANLPNVIHVHKMCIEWAPQVYYINETVQNLEAEVARGAKLKCSKCGLKGAALGCYLKSCRRSYHYTCALEMLDCRWDYESYLVLCPSHSSIKFPNEKSKTRKKAVRIHSLPTQMCETHDPSNGDASPNETNKLIFCGSALSSEERNLLVKYAKICGATVTKFWKPDVTHVVAATNENDACTRTFKVLMAVLNGRWVLKMDWIKACLEANCVVNEEPYEICLDNYGCSDGPKTGRMRAVSDAPKLFSGLTFYFAGDDFPRAYKEDLKELVIAAGGTVAQRKEELAALNHNDRPSPRKLVVYNLESPAGCMVGEEVSILWKRLNEAEDIAIQIGAQVVGNTWLVESIAACNLQDLVS